jgi:hypothetical protein
MSILFPLILVPTYVASNGDDLIFYSVVAGILSGSVAGDHMSPISDTTVLSALACECGLLEHVETQAPYAIIVVVISTLFGTIPIGYGAWPNIVGILLGALSTAAFVYLFCVPVISPTGKFDIFTELYLRVSNNSSLIQLKADTVKVYNGEHPSEDREKGEDDVQNIEGGDKDVVQNIEGGDDDVSTGKAKKDVNPAENAVIDGEEAGA